LTLFGAVTFISFVDMLVARGTFTLGPWRRDHTIHGTGLGLVLTIVGALLAVAVGAYSGVLLSVTNIPGWTNSVLIGAVYVATSLRTGVAGVVLVQTLRGRPDADLIALQGTSTWLIVWWLVMMVAFFATLGDASRFFLVGLPLLAMILAIILGGLVPLGLRFMRHTAGTAIASAGLVLLGGLLVRYAIVMGPQVGH
jgi:formate-dependent nitrite reductase membrane component NrfD